MKTLIQLAEIVIWVKWVAKRDRGLNEVFESAGPG